MRKFEEKEDCFMTYEQLPWKKGKPETRVTAHLCPPLFSFQKHPPKIILESSCSKISQNSVGNTRGGFS